MSELVIPDVELIFKTQNNLSIVFKDKKEVTESELFDLYIGLENYLKNSTNVIVDKYTGVILGMKK